MFSLFSRSPSNEIRKGLQNASKTRKAHADRSSSRRSEPFMARIDATIWCGVIEYGNRSKRKARYERIPRRKVAFDGLTKQMAFPRRFLST